MTCLEGALLVGNTRAAPTLKHPSHKPRPTHSATECVSFDGLELCSNQTGEQAISALSYYLSTMVSHLKEKYVVTAINEHGTSVASQDVVLTGVITAVPDTLENSENAYWEMLVIENNVDVDNVRVVARELVANPDKLETVLLYPKSLPRFTGAYPGVVVRVKGTVFKYDIHGQPTSIGVTEACFPSRPPISWGPPSAEEATNPTPARIHLVAGPYTRGTFDPIVHAIRTAALRGANTLVMYGPFIAETSTVDTNTLNGTTFDDALNDMFDHVEATLQEATVASSNLAKVYFVPSLNDINNFPILPQPKFGIQEGSDKYQVVSNPCTINVGGLNIKLANYPSIDAVAAVMMERWNDRQQRLLRAGECVLRDRLLVPLFGFPSERHDLTCLNALALMDDLEMEPPHMVVFSSDRDHALAFVSHSDMKDLSDPSPDGAVVVALSTTGRKIEGGRYGFEAVEVTVPDLKAAVTGGMGGNRCTVTILHETCPVDY